MTDSLTSESLAGAAADAAIEQLFEVYADDIYRFVRYCAPQTVDARDVVQEVFMRAFRTWHTFRRDASPKTWLFQIARHYVYDLLRKKRTERAYLQTHRPTLADVSVSLDSLVEVEDALIALTRDQRQVVVLRLIEDMSVSEVATILGWSESKVKTTLHRALKALRSELGQEIEGRQTGTREDSDS